MKGVIFTELVNLVEDQFGYEVVDRMIDDAKLDNNGAFTTIGTYDYKSLLKMVGSLAEQTQLEAATLVRIFGRHLFKVFSTKHADKLSQLKTAFELIEKVEDFIHVEVRKIYPDAQLPSFEYRYEGDDTLVVQYRSQRPFADVCQGLIEQCIEHYGENIQIERCDVTNDATAANFYLTRQTELAEV